MSILFNGTEPMEDIKKIYERMEANCPEPWSNSKPLWDIRQACNIADHNTGIETLLEKAVAMLAKKGYMPGWYNQCPAASGINDSDKDRGSRVDLVHLSKSDDRARLVELKVNWGSNGPSSALRQILRYGAAYIFCRVHRKELPLQVRPLMDVSHVSLEVVAPRHLYNRYDERRHLERMRKSLDEFAGSKTVQDIGISSMSLDALAFPAEFEIPFKNGGEVKQKCDTGKLTDKGRQVRDAFNKLAPAWPAL